VDADLNGETATRIYLADSVGANSHLLVALDGQCPYGISHIRWSPDGKYIVFHRAEWLQLRQHWALYVMNANGKDLRKITPDSLEATNPDW
jgi:Tol biopolymer transport system component